jgi:hypothetical protein
MLLERIVKKWGRKCFSVFNPENRIFYEFWENILFIHQILFIKYFLLPSSFFLFPSSAYPRSGYQYITNR